MLFVLRIVFENIGKNRKKNVNPVEQGVAYPSFVSTQWLSDELVKKAG